MDCVSKGALKIQTSHCGKAVASPAAVLPTCPLTFTTNDEVCANKAASHFQLKCTSVGFPSSTTFSLSPSQPRALSANIDIITDLSSCLNLEANCAPPPSPSPSLATMSKFPTLISSFPRGVRPDLTTSKGSLLIKLSPGPGLGL